MTLVNLTRLWREAWRFIAGDRHSDNPNIQCVDGQSPDKQTLQSGAVPPDRKEIVTLALARLDAGEYQQYLETVNLIEVTRQTHFLFGIVPFKQVLTARLPLPEAFEVYRALLKLPGSEAIEH